MIKTAIRIIIRAAIVILWLLSSIWLVQALVSTKSRDAGVWESLADTGSIAVIIAIGAEVLEIVAKILLGACKKVEKINSFVESKRPTKRLKLWFEHHEFELDILAGMAWVTIVLGLMLELHGTKIARKISNDENQALNQKAESARLKTAQLESENLKLKERVIIMESRINPIKIDPAMRARIVKGLNEKFPTNSPIPHVDVFFIPQNERSYSLAMDCLSVLTDAHFDATPKSWPGQLPEEFGSWVLFGGVSPGRGVAVSILFPFKDEGLLIGIRRNEQISSNTIGIFIGSRLTE